MENMDLAFLQNKLESSPPSHNELKKLTSDISRNILLKINSCSESIAEAKEAAETARNRKIGIFGIGSKKKVNATSEALVQTNKALVEMNNVVQESIKFTCVSYAFAEIMRDTLQIMIAKGFKNTDGRLVKLNDNGREAAELVLQETESFARRQREQEAQLTNLKSDITQNAENISKNAEKIGKNVSKINKNKNNIGINATNIEQLQNLLQENIDRIENLEKFSNKKLIIVLFILTFLSLSIGIISLVSL